MRFVVIDMVLSPIRPISLKWIYVPWQVSWLADQAEVSPSQPNRPVDQETPSPLTVAGAASDWG